VGKLKNGVGGWIEGEEEKQMFITNYFTQLFRSSTQGNVHQLLQAVRPCGTTAMNADLVSDFTQEEIKMALEAIGDLKAPGPDGMPAIFYKKFWSVMGSKITAEVLAVLRGGPMPDL
jgi:hypothetical protein